MKKILPSSQLSWCTATTLLLLALTPAVAFAQPATAESSRLTGAWTLVAADEIHPDGSRTQAYGPHPQGLMLVDDSGRYSLQIFRPERPKFATGDKHRGTPAEYEAAVLGTSAHIGHCRIDWASHTLVFQIEFASFPNLDGVEQRRPFELSGDELSYRIPPNAAGVVSVTVWHRIGHP